MASFGGNDLKDLGSNWPRSFNLVNGKVLYLPYSFLDIDAMILVNTSFDNGNAQIHIKIYLTEIGLSALEL